MSSSSSSAPPPIVAVTGASGYIGSHVCLNLVQHGYRVRACVRDASCKERTEHLLKMNTDTTPLLSLHSADMRMPHAYDEIFQDCTAVFHVAGNFGTDSRWTEATTVAGRPPPVQQALGETTATTTTTSYDQGVYDSYVVSLKYILDSIEHNSQSVKKLIYTSSGCAGPFISQHDSDDEYSLEENAYGKAKMDCEKLLYDFGQQHDDSIVCCSSCPHHVLGPILSPIHDMTYQHRLGEIYCQKYNLLDQTWEICDVRDVADTQRRMLECTAKVKNGSRYSNTCSSKQELSPQQLLHVLHQLFPSHYNNNDNAAVMESSGESGYESDSSSGVSSSTSSSSSSCCLDWNTHHCTKWQDPERELGLQRHAIQDTIRDTIVSMQEFDMLDRQDVSIQELRNFYTVAEMDGCQEEMEYVLTQLQQRQE